MVGWFGLFGGFGVWVLLFVCSLVNFFFPQKINIVTKSYWEKKHYNFATAVKKFTSEGKLQSANAARKTSHPLVLLNGLGLLLSLHLLQISSVQLHLDCAGRFQYYFEKGTVSETGHKAGLLGLR